jgi:hypothetical protein
MLYIIFFKYPVDNSCPILIILLSIKPEYNIQKYVFFQILMISNTDLNYLSTKICIIVFCFVTGNECHDVELVVKSVWKLPIFP